MHTLERIPIRGLADKLTDEEFAEFCAANRDYRIERDKFGNIIFMSPVHTDSGYFEEEIASALKVWSKKTKTGVAFSSSTGFKLPNTAIRSPGASWVAMEKWQALSDKEKKSFAPVCPDFVMEIRSRSDKLKDVQEKIQEWLDNGAQLGWLIDVAKEASYIYRADSSIETVKGFDKTLGGKNVLPGFEFDLNNLELP